MSQFDEHLFAYVCNKLEVEVGVGVGDNITINKCKDILTAYLEARPSLSALLPKSAHLYKSGYHLLKTYNADMMVAYWFFDKDNKEFGTWYLFYTPDNYKWGNVLEAKTASHSPRGLKSMEFSYVSPLLPVDVNDAAKS